MAEEKKRFPWRLVVCAVVLVPLAAALGLFETVGRKGTIIGRYDRVKKGMSWFDVTAILGPASDNGLDGNLLDLDSYTVCWQEGPATIVVEFDPETVVLHKRIATYPPFTRDHFWWHVHRWAEKAYTAIHGPGAGKRPGEDRATRSKWRHHAAPGAVKSFIAVRAIACLRPKNAGEQRWIGTVASPVIRKFWAPAFCKRTAA